MLHTNVEFQAWNCMVLGTAFRLNTSLEFEAGAAQAGGGVGVQPQAQNLWVALAPAKKSRLVLTWNSVPTNLDLAAKLQVQVLCTP